MSSMMMFDHLYMDIVADRTASPCWQTTAQCLDRSFLDLYLFFLASISVYSVFHFVPLPRRSEHY